MQKMLGLLLVLALGSADAALLSRLDGHAYYDTVLDITWLQNTELWKTNNFGSGVSTSNGLTGVSSQTWIAAMNAANYAGYADWRLPTISPVNGLAFNETLSYDGSTDRGFRISAAGSPYAGSTASELAFMFYNNLGGTSYYTTTGGINSPLTQPPNYRLPNTGPFASSIRTASYLTGMPRGASDVWIFAFISGGQTFTNQNTLGNAAWVVRDGDSALHLSQPLPPPDTVPVPAAVWLFGSALGVLAFARRVRSDPARVGLHSRDAAGAP